jgi:hypothetical protein
MLLKVVLTYFDKQEYVKDPYEPSKKAAVKQANPDSQNCGCNKNTVNSSASSLRLDQSKAESFFLATKELEPEHYQPIPTKL